MTTPATQREADAQKALAAITDRLALTYRICCGTSPKQSVGELLDVTINMPEWEIVRAALASPIAAPEASGSAYEYQPRHENGMLLDWAPLPYADTEQEARDYCEPRGFAWRRAAPEAHPAATDQPSAGQVDERARFDARAIAAGFDVSRDTYGEYHSVDLRRYWSGWQWHASLTPTAPQAASQQAEQIQWRNIQKVLREVAVFCFGSAQQAGDVSLGAAYTAVFNSLSAKDGLRVELEPLDAPQSATTASASAKEVK